MKKYDAIVIGFGKGGKTLAAKLAASGKTVAMIEKDPGMYGGTCINVGCIPSKSLVRSSGLAELEPGRSFEEKAAFYAEAMAEKRRLTSMLRGKNFAKLDDLENVTIYNGTGSFVSDTVVRVRQDSETIEIQGDRIFINTGSASFVPSIEGIEGNPFVYLSDGLLALDRLPKRLAIVGGGYIGLEFASIYSGFGSQVTVLQDDTVLIGREDRDIAEVIQQALEAKGVSFRLGAKIARIANAGDHARVVYSFQGQEQTLEADAVLIATGRRPNVKDLHVENAGVELTERGAIKTDDGRKTTAPNIWAMGDVVGGLQFTYVSLDDFRIVWSQLNGGDYEQTKRKNVPYSVFIEPSFSRVGLNEAEALKAGYNIKIAKLPAAAIPKAQALKNPKGLLKAVIDADTDQILGVMLFCEESYEMINIVKLAMDMGAKYQVLRDQIYTHPTMSEALNDLFAV